MEVILNIQVLATSYDSLVDDYQKNLFLDIACFFNGTDYNYAVRILDGLSIGARVRINNLIVRDMRYGKGNCSSRITQMSKNMASHGSLYSIERNKCKYLVLFSYLISLSDNHHQESVFRHLKKFMFLLSFLIYF